MLLEQRGKEYACRSCGKVFTSLARFQHHLAAVHAPKSLQDIRTMKDVRTSGDIRRSTGSNGGANEGCH